VMETGSQPDGAFRRGVVAAGNWFPPAGTWIASADVDTFGRADKLRYGVREKNHEL